MVYLDCNRTEGSNASAKLIKLPVKFLKFSTRGTLVEYGGKLSLC